MRDTAHIIQGDVIQGDVVSTSISKGPTLGEQIYDLLKERIVNGEYRPGEALVESEVAAALGVSRTPVSNAFTTLRERGLLDYREGRFSIARLSLEEVIDLYVCRLAFDGLATRLAAARTTEADAAELEGYLRVWDEADDEGATSALWVADLRFHETIYALSDNAHLIRFSNIAAELLALYRRSTIARLEAIASKRSVRPARSRDDVVAEHEAILDALRSGDGDRAERAARVHVQRVIANLERLDEETALAFMEVGGP